MQNTFKKLDQFMLDNQVLWRFEPFHDSINPSNPWNEPHPGLSAWLESLDQGDIEQFKSDSLSLSQHIQRFCPELAEINTLIQLPFQDAQPLAFDSHLFNGIPGRKLEQITSMGELSVELHRGEEWLEWCSGKGYLGRILAASTKQQVTSFEFQHSLCEAGQSQAEALELPMTFIQGDALIDEPLACMHDKQHAVALHACGDLHVNLLYKATQKFLPAMTISPCCYHLIESDQYQPMSLLAQSSKLVLSKQELRIPLQETVTGGERVKRHRFQEMSYRLGFDLMLRELGISKEYIAIPSIKKSQLALGFESFCIWAANKKSLNLPSVNFTEYHNKGIARFWQMERISLIQQLFRRPLELWLVLDKALYLQQQGYNVSLSQFCSREVTPRNILLHAYRD
ncbi:SAM-dependent methyltransferase [Vibrio kyushuensis]|uniref:methyltransferase n=1 Tax=Vibrio kyushuensis TaxID=2910249 RepID=UPI003D0C0E8C